MSEANNNGFPFSGTEDSAELDISAKDEITDGAMTFEELRIAKSDDFPELTVRMSCGGTYCELDPALVFEDLGETSPPQEWRNNITIQGLQKNANFRLRETLEQVQWTITNPGSYSIECSIRPRS